jgi:hypothetical protein
MHCEVDLAGEKLGNWLSLSQVFFTCLKIRMLENLIIRSTRSSTAHEHQFDRTPSIFAAASDGGVVR